MVIDVEKQHKEVPSTNSSDSTPRCYVVTMSFEYEAPQMSSSGSKCVKINSHR